MEENTIRDSEHVVCSARFLVVRSNGEVAGTFEHLLAVEGEVERITQYLSNHTALTTTEPEQKEFERTTTCWISKKSLPNNSNNKDNNKNSSSNSNTESNYDNDMERDHNTLASRPGGMENLPCCMIGSGVVPIYFCMVSYLPFPISKGSRLRPANGQGNPPCSITVCCSLTGLYILLNFSRSKT